MKLHVENGKVYTFKLNSGEELVTKVIDSTDEYVEIEDPVSVAPGPQGMGLVPSMFTADPDIKPKLNNRSVSMYSPTDDSVRMKYIEMITGITVPDKKILVG